MEDEPRKPRQKVDPSFLEASKMEEHSKNMFYHYAHYVLSDNKIDILFQQVEMICRDVLKDNHALKFKILYRMNRKKIYSFETMLKKVKRKSPLLIVCQLKNGNVVGAYVSCGLMSKSKYRRKYKTFRDNLEVILFDLNQDSLFRPETNSDSVNFIESRHTNSITQKSMPNPRFSEIDSNRKRVRSHFNNSINSSKNFNFKIKTGGNISKFTHDITDFEQNQDVKDISIYQSKLDLYQNKDNQKSQTNVNKHVQPLVYFDSKQKQIIFGNQEFVIGDNNFFKDSCSTKSGNVFDLQNQSFFGVDCSFKLKHLIFFEVYQE